MESSVRYIFVPLAVTGTEGSFLRQRRSEVVPAAKRMGNELRRVPTVPCPTQLRTQSKNADTAKQKTYRIALQGRGQGVDPRNGDSD